MHRFFAVAVAAVCLSLSAVAMVRAEGPKEYADISIAELKSAIAEKTVTLIDANGTDSWTQAHLPGAADFEGNKDKLAAILPTDKNALIVAYCGGPQCNAYKAAVKAAMAMGYTNVKHLSAGISGWTAAGEKTEKAG